MVWKARKEEVVHVGNDHAPSERLLRSLNTWVLSRSNGYHRPKTWLSLARE